MKIQDGSHRCPQCSWPMAMMLQWGAGRLVCLDPLWVRPRPRGLSFQCDGYSNLAAREIHRCRCRSGRMRRDLCSGVTTVGGGWSGTHTRKACDDQPPDPSHLARIWHDALVARALNLPRWIGDKNDQQFELY